MTIQPAKAVVWGVTAETIPLWDGEMSRTASHSHGQSYGTAAQEGTAGHSGALTKAHRLNRQQK